MGRQQIHRAPVLCHDDPELAAAVARDWKLFQSEVAPELLHPEKNARLPTARRGQSETARWLGLVSCSEAWAKSLASDFLKPNARTLGKLSGPMRFGRHAHSYSARPPTIESKDWDRVHQDAATLAARFRVQAIIACSDAGVPFIAYARSRWSLARLMGTDGRVRGARRGPSRRSSPRLAGMPEFFRHLDWYVAHDVMDQCVTQIAKAEEQYRPAVTEEAVRSALVHVRSIRERHRATLILSPPPVEIRALGSLPRLRLACPSDRPRRGRPPKK
ncbi:MAG: hypothetical protein HY905_08795 [Deltaproteobacteria bacterium]|nr:hypothetical protein [Deltaproteobacteria bacterium]